MGFFEGSAMNSKVTTEVIAIDGNGCVRDVLAREAGSTTSKPEGMAGHPAGLISYLETLAFQQPGMASIDESFWLKALQAGLSDSTIKEDPSHE